MDPFNVRLALPRVIVLLAVLTLNSCMKPDAWTERFEEYGRSERRRLLAVGSDPRMARLTAEMHLGSSLYSRDDHESTSLLARFIADPEGEKHYEEAFFRGLQSSESAPDIPRVELSAQFRKSLSAQYSNMANEREIPNVLEFARKTVDTGSPQERIAVAKLLFLTCVDHPTHSKIAIQIMNAAKLSGESDSKDALFWQNLIENANEVVK